MEWWCKCMDATRLPCASVGEIAYVRKWTLFSVEQSVNQLCRLVYRIQQATCALCIFFDYYTHNSMLTSHQIAKVLISRKQQHEDTSITTSSYEMIDQVDPDSSDDVPRRHFWGLNLRNRRNSHDVQDEANGRRVVSEPLPSGLRKMAVLRRFRFGRHDQDVDEGEGDLTISTETVSLSFL